MAKIISKIILLAVISMALIIFVFYIILNQRIYNVVDKEKYILLVKEINASEDLPDRFYKIYGQVTEYNKKSTTGKYFLYRIIRNKIKPCPCIEISSHLSSNAIDRWAVGLALDKEASPKKCLDFYLSKFDFLYNTRGVRNASRFYYQKDLEQLSDEEIYELSVMTLNITYYNKIRNPEKLKLKVAEIKAKS